jgi:hypothetical protein
MSYDNSSEIVFRQGEGDILDSAFTGVGAATAIINAGSTFTLYDQLQALVAGFVNVPVTGYDAGSNLTTGRVWYNFDSTGLAPGVYYGVFSYSIVGADTLVRNNKPDLQIQVLAIVEIIATYDLTTLRGQIRLWGRDKDMVNPINSDLEIDSCLFATGYIGAGADTFQSLYMGTVFLAAAFVFDLMAADAAKVAIIEKIGAISENTKVTYDALKEEAALLRARASRDFVPGVSLIPDPLYTPPWLAVPSTGLRGCFTSLDTW